MDITATVWTLLPPIIAIALALITKEVYSSLLIGILAGALLYTGFNPLHAVETTFEIMGGKLGDNINICIFLVLLGITDGDTEDDAVYLADKTVKMRVFTDENDKMNRSLADVGGGLLIVSQFTLYGDCRKGNRPSFTKGAAPDEANRLYEYFASLVRNDGIALQTGWFGAMMDVQITNNGPFTIWLDSNELIKR